MVKLGIIQTCSFSSNEQGLNKVSKMLEGLGRKETDIVCLPAQRISSNQILNIRLISQFIHTFSIILL